MLFDFITNALTKRKVNKLIIKEMLTDPDGAKRMGNVYDFINHRIATILNECVTYKVNQNNVDYITLREDIEAINEMLLSVYDAVPDYKIDKKSFLYPELTGAVFHKGDSPAIGIIFYYYDKKDSINGRDYILKHSLVSANKINIRMWNIKIERIRALLNYREVFVKMYADDLLWLPKINI